MRNPLKRLARHDQPKRPLRERLAGAKGKLVAVREKYGRTLRVHRALNAPLPAPVPAVDRVALVNYATWLHHERFRVCTELYPHMGVKAVQFTLGLNAAEQFFYPDGRASEGGRAWKDVAPASSRAVRVLDLVGVDWRSDQNESTRRFFEDSGRADTGERPATPHGWPDLDAELTEALDDLTRLDAAIDAILSGGPDRDSDTVPGYEALDKARDAALGRLAKVRARGLPGLQAKAHALLSPTVQGFYEEIDRIAASLARDLIGSGPAVLDQHRPDPIFAVIDEAWRLTHEHGRLHAVAGRLPDADPAWGPANEAHSAMWDYIDATLLKTIPRTAEGCKALARFTLAFTKDQGVPIAQGDDNNNAVLALIAHSPLST